MKYLLFVAVLLATAICRAQEPPTDFLSRDTIRSRGFRLPDSLMNFAPEHPDRREEASFAPMPVVTMSSVRLFPEQRRSSRVMLLENNTLRLGRHFTVGNGSAWTNGTYYNAYLDARTLSLPLPR